MGWWRVHVLGLRLHHGAVGAALVAGAFLPSRRLARAGMLAAGIALAAHDWPDRPWLP